MSSLSSTTSPPIVVTTAKLVVTSNNKADLSTYLNRSIVSIALDAIKDHNSFIVALSGGSLPSFLSSLVDAFGTTTTTNNNNDNNNNNDYDVVVDPQWSKWHILLADERCVPLDDVESNLSSIQQYFIQHTGIPPQQVYGINQDMVSRLGVTTTTTATTSATAVVVADIAEDYERTLREVLTKYTDHGYIDLAVLGFGPDGHTCSLFPDHPLLDENTLWVAPIIDSPKPPPNRITLTFPILNYHTKHIIVCGAGSSKYPIVRTIFERLDKVTTTTTTTDMDDSCTDELNGTTVIYDATMKSPTPFPSAMVKPLQTLTWLIDADAMNGE